MKSYIRKVKTKSGATAVQIEHKLGRDRVGITHVGSAHNDAELNVLLAMAQEKIHERQLKLELLDQGNPDICMEKSCSVLLWETLEEVYSALGFDAVGDQVFKQLVLARIIEPTSKLDTIRVLDELGLDTPSNSSIHRCLRRVVENEYRNLISQACLKNTATNSLALVLYDVTTLYFEAQREDDYRKSGLSKERRLDPQITVGMLVDRNGFPLEIQSFEGNKAEVKTLLPVLAGFRQRHKIEHITVTADAAMLSAGNIAELEKLGYHYIIGSRLAKTPYEIEEYLAEENSNIKDGQIFESNLVVTIEGKRKQRRVVYQYRQKRAALDLSNIEKTLAKAQKMVDKKVDMKRNRFLKLSGARPEINEELVQEARRKAGIKGYVTDLEIPAQQVIDAYHTLFQVEKSFRMSKSDLKARPIFHHKRDSIEAHLTIVFSALALSRTIEKNSGISIGRFVKMIKPIRTGILSIKGVSYSVKPKIPDDIQKLLTTLR